MLTVRAPLSSRLPTRPDTRALARVVEWSIFLAALAVFVQSYRGQIRTTGPTVLLAAMLPGLYFQLLRGERAIVRFFVLLVAMVGGRMLHPGPAGTVHAWLGWHLLLGGLAYALLDSIPAAMANFLKRFFDRMAAAPTGRTAVLFSIAGVVLPGSVLFMTTTMTPVCGDTMPVVATVSRMYLDGTRDLSPFAVEPREKRWAAFGAQFPPYNMNPSPYADGLYSAYPAGMEVFAWPGVLWCAARGSDLRDDDVHCRIETRTAAVVAAIGLALFFLTALHVTSGLAAYATAIALAVGSAFFTTFSQLLWQQGGVAFWSIVILFVEVASTGRPSRGGAIVQGIACGLMIACRPLSALFLVPFGVWVLVRDWRRGLLVPVVAWITFAPFAVIYWKLHHSLTGPSIGLYHGIGWPSLSGLAGVLFSPGRGLLVYQPLLLLLPLAMWAAGRSDRLGRIGFYPFVLVFAAVHCLFVSGWTMWWGGHSFGSRLVSEVIPALALAAAPVVGWLLRRPIGAAAVSAIVVAGLLVHHNAAYHLAMAWNADPDDVDRHTARLWEWSKPPFAYIHKER